MKKLYSALAITLTALLLTSTAPFEQFSGQFKILCLENRFPDKIVGESCSEAAISFDKKLLWLLIPIFIQD